MNRSQLLPIILFTASLGIAVYWGLTSPDKVSKCLKGQSTYKLVNAQNIHPTIMQVPDEYIMRSYSHCNVTEVESLTVRAVYPDMRAGTSADAVNSLGVSEALVTIKIKNFGTNVYEKVRENSVLPDEVKHRLKLEERHNGLLFLGFHPDPKPYENGRNFGKLEDGSIREYRSGNFWLVPTEEYEGSIEYMSCLYDGSLFPEKGSCHVKAQLNSELGIEFQILAADFDDWHNFVLKAKALVNSYIVDNDLILLES